MSSWSSNATNDSSNSPLPSKKNYGSKIGLLILTKIETLQNTLLLLFGYLGTIEELSQRRLAVHAIASIGVPITGFVDRLTVRVQTRTNPTFPPVHAR
eukprot:scaffold14136_cov76-Amphora_coffeaeformis.AAC.1